MVYSKLLISILAVLALRYTLADTEKDDVPAKIISDEARVKRSSDGEFLSKDEMRPRKQKKIAPIDGEDSSEASPVRKANERQHSSGNHTKKFRAKEPDDSAEVKETKPSTSKIIETSPSNIEKVETAGNSEKKSEVSAGKSASVIASKDELPIKEKTVKKPDLAEAPVVPASPPAAVQVPATNVIPHTDPQVSPQAPADGSDSFAIFYYFSGVLFFVLATLAFFLYKFLFKPPTPQQSARAAAAGGASSYAKVPQSDLEMSLSSASRAAAGKEESDWEEWEGEEKLDSAPAPLPLPLPTISSQTSNISSHSDNEQETLPQLGSRASPSSGGAVSGGSSSSSVSAPMSRSGGSPPFQSTKAAVAKRESRRSPTMETSNSDLFASIGISAAPKFQPPISKKPAVGSSRGPIAPSPEPAHRVSKVLLKDNVDAGQWGDEDELDGLSDMD